MPFHALLCFPVLFLAYFKEKRNKQQHSKTKNDSFSRCPNKGKVLVSVLIYNYIYDYIEFFRIQFVVFIVHYHLISKRKPSMTEALLWLIYQDKKYSMKVIVSFSMEVQKFKTFKGKILRQTNCKNLHFSKPLGFEWFLNVRII